MAKKYTGLVQFELGQQRETIYFEKVPTAQHLTTFLEVLKTFTNAGVRKYATTITEYLNEAGNTTESEDIDEVLLVQLEYFDDDHELHTFTLPIPAPDRSRLELIEARGYRLPQADGDLIAQAYSTLTGESYTFRDAWLFA